MSVSRSQPQVSKYESNYSSEKSGEYVGTVEGSLKLTNNLRKSGDSSLRQDLIQTEDSSGFSGEPNLEAKSRIESENDISQVRADLKHKMDLLETGNRTENFFSNIRPVAQERNNYDYGSIKYSYNQGHDEAVEFILNTYNRKYNYKVHDTYAGVGDLKQVGSEHNQKDALSRYVTEEELDRKSDYFTQLVRLEFSGSNPEDLLEDDDSGILDWYEDDPEKVEQDFERFLRTARQDRLPERYQEKFAEAIAEDRLAHREAVYNKANIEFNHQEEFQEIKQDLLNRLWT